MRPKSSSYARMLQLCAPAALSCLALLGASPPPVAPQPVKNSEPPVVAVTGYVRALSARDYAGAYALLTSAQQRYFDNVRNFASNAAAAHTSIGKFSVESAVSRGAIVEVVIREDVTFFDIATQQLVKASVREPYFALHDGSAWRVKQLYQPWKSYAPNVVAKTRGVSVTIARIEFYDQRVKIDCTIRNTGTTGVQILPLDKTVLEDGSERIAAMKEPQFPLNDVGFFEGLRLEPGHQAVGFINFPLARRDAAMRFTLALGPAIQDGTDQTFDIVVGPFELPKL